jgi:uncharacterized protein involved in exopolysaccharide biosynthesis
MENGHPDERLCFNVRPGTARHDAPSSLTLRDLMAVGFRHSEMVVRTFLAIFLVIALYILLRPRQYESEMKILVKQERVDPVVSSDESSPSQNWQTVSEAQLNSEVELLKSRDLLTKVVVATGLPERNKTGIAARLWTLLTSRMEKEVLANRLEKGFSSYDQLRVARAVHAVEQELDVQPLRKSNVIRVSYTSADPTVSATVLRALADRYLEKHLAVHRPSGAFDFFDQQAEQYRKTLADYESRLAQYDREHGVVSGEVEKEIALRQLADVEGNERSTRAQIAETEHRIRALQAEAASTPARTTTEVRSGSVRLAEQMQTTLTTLELKRIEMSQRFQPDYPPLQAVTSQIASLKASMAAAADSPAREETTGRDPTHAYLETELAKNRAELAALRARAGALAATAAAHRANALRLERIDLVEKDLSREVKQAEQNYLLHARKREEARVSNALDLRRFLNVAVSQEPTVPYQPSGIPRSLQLLLAAMFAGVSSVGLAFAADYREPQASRQPRTGDPPRH